MDINNFLASGGLLNTFLTLGLLIGGFFAVRRGAARQQSESMQETISILQSQIAAIEKSLDNVKEENSYLKHVLETIQAALKGRGIIISIDGDLVTISDKAGSTSSLLKKREITTEGTITQLRPRRKRTPPKETQTDD